MNVMDIFKLKIGTFENKVMPNTKMEKGILNSEGFAFCALAEYLRTDLIMESGVYNGGSTTIIGKFFTDIPILSIDIETKLEAIIRTSIFHNVTIVNGDSMILLSQIIDVFKDKRIALIIDGPKSVKAISLAGKCFDNDNVVLVGIHDLFRNLYGKQKQDRVLFDNLDVEKFITDDDEFVNTFSYLDTNNKGVPYEKQEKYCCGKQGYGPTLGLMIKGTQL